MNEKIKIRKIHELKKEKHQIFNKRLNELDRIRKQQSLEIATL